MSPYFWLHGDLQRSLKEWKFWFGWTFYAGDHKLDFTALRDYYIYPEDFPDFSKDTPAPIFYVDNDNVTAEIIDYTWRQGNGILVWRNATQGAHLPMMDLDWVRENFDMEKYYEGQGDLEKYFFWNDTDWDKAYQYPALGPHSPIKMQEFVDNTLDGDHLPYYLGFNLKLLAENLNLRKLVLGWFDRIVAPAAGEEHYFASKAGKIMFGTVKYFNEFSFMGYGNENYATMHNGIADDSFIQIANTKRWILIHTRYFPYIHIIYRHFASMMMIDFPEVPHVVVDVGPGDFLYFPPAWCHAVVNMDDTWGMGIAVRDYRKTMQQMVKKFLFGSSVEADVGNSFHQWFQFMKAKLTGNDPSTVQQKRRSAVDVNAQQYIMDEFQIGELHKHTHDMNNKYEHYYNPEVKRGVDYGNGRKFKSKPFSSTNFPVQTTEGAKQRLRENADRSMLDAADLKDFVEERNAKRIADGWKYEL